ncbi:partial 50S ribosomal protein L25, partial [uncultured bacterium]
MAIPALKAEVRTTVGTKQNRKLRAEGKLPGVLYGKGKENVNLLLDSLAVKKLMHDAEHVVELDLAGAKSHALMRAAQMDHFGDE